VNEAERQQTELVQFRFQTAPFNPSDNSIRKPDPARYQHDQSHGYQNQADPLSLAQTGRQDRIDAPELNGKSRKAGQNKIQPRERPTGKPPSFDAPEDRKYNY
jgi:hypothetical protein